MTNKRNDALDALTKPKPSPADVVPIRAGSGRKAPKAPDDVVRVMLYLPHRVKRAFDDMAHSAERRAHDYYVMAIEKYLRDNGYSKAADLLTRR
jgi:hypothetical protein